MSTTNKDEKQAVATTAAKAPWDATVALMEAYPKDKFNQLLPTVTVADVAGGLYKPTVEVVRIDADPEAGEVYQDKRMKQGTFALGRRALQKFMHAGGLIFPPQLNRCEWNATSCLYHAAGALKKADGSLLILTGSKLVDLELEAIKFRAQVENRNEWRAKDKKPVWTEKEMQQQVDRDLIQARENMLQNAETKAQNRVIRKAYALKDAYTVAELSRPFVLIRYDTNFDPSDPGQMKLIMQQANDASGRLFGAPVDGPPPGQPIEVSVASVDTPAAVEVDPLDEPPPAEVDPDELAIAELKTLSFDELKARFKKAVGSIAFDDQGEKEQLLHAWRKVHTVEDDAEKVDQWARYVLATEKRAEA